MMTRLRSELSSLPLALTVVAGAGGCYAGARGGVGPAGAASAAAAPSFAVTERAEPGPITALAFHAPFLYVGSGSSGLRRVDVDADEYEWMDAVVPLVGRHVSALGADGSGNVWMASDRDIVRLIPGPSGIRYEPVASLQTIRWLVPVEGAAAPAAWAANETGLYRVEGRRVTPVEALRGVA